MSGQHTRCHLCGTNAMTVNKGVRVCPHCDNRCDTPNCKVCDTLRLKP